MLTLNFSVGFSDLKFEKQQDMIASVKESLLGQYKEEAESGRFGKNFGRNEYKDMSWQEAFCREYAIDFVLWETEKEAREFNWNYAVEEYAEKEAEDKCETSMSSFQVEVEA